MNKKIFITLVLTVLFLINGFAFAGGRNSGLEPPPSSIKLKVKPPKDFNEALKRVTDYLILNMILPPVIDRENVKSQLYGKFKENIKEYIVKNKINLDRISREIQQKLNTKKEKLEDIKASVFKELITSKEPTQKREKLKKSKKASQSSMGYYIALGVVLIILAGGVLFTKNKKV